MVFVTHVPSGEEDTFWHYVVGTKKEALWAAGEFVGNKPIKYIDTTKPGHPPVSDFPNHVVVTKQRSFYDGA